MDEEKVRDNDNNNISDTRPQPIILPPESNPGDRPSSEHGSEDTFLSLSPDSTSGHKIVENIGISPNVDKYGSNQFSKFGSPNVDKNSPSNKPQADKYVWKVNDYRNGPANRQQLAKDDNKVHHIDTAAPFESVKEAVSKFGVIVDWKAHRAQNIERRKYIEQELEKAEQEIPAFKEKSEQAEKEKEHVLHELDSAKRCIQDLKLKLERAQTEETQAKQDSELAHLRVQEMEQGIADESSVAAKTQLEVAKARHQAAAADLITATNELEETRKDYQILISERDAAVQKAQQIVSQAKEAERLVEDLTIQLIATKETIESTHASHLEAEEQRVQEAKYRDQYAINMDIEVKQTEDELKNVKEQIVFAKDLRSKLETSSGLLRNLKDELAIYMQGKVPEVEDDDKFTRKHIQSGVAGAKKNLEEVNSEIGGTSEEIVCLKTAAASLTAKLESEKQVLNNIRKQKGLGAGAGAGAGAVVNLESDLKRTQSELDNIRKREKEARAKLVELPKQFKKAREEADKVRASVEKARSGLKKVKEEAKEAKSGVNSIEGRLAATQKQIDAVRAQEKLALGAIKALNESPQKPDDPKGGVSISLQEYYEMSKRAHAAEEAANKRIKEADAKIDEAKDSEMQSLKKLTQLNSENAARKDALNAAIQRAETARESTLSIEEELKKRKGEDDPTQKPEAAPKVGLFKRLSQKGSYETPPSPGPSTGSASPSTSNGGAEGSSNAGEAAQDGKGFFRRRKKLVMPKMNFINMKKKPLFSKGT